MPLVSVIILTYNHAPYIRQCIDSLLNQKTHFSYEILIGEDESTDGTREICTEYAERYPEKIKLFLRSRKDVIYIGGKATGRFNFIETLKQAKGKYIAFCDGDDYWTDSYKLQKQVDILDQNENCNICFTRSLNQYNGDLILQPHPDNNRRIFDYSDLISINNFINTATLVYRNILKEPFPDWFLKLPFGDLGLYVLLARQSKIFYLEDVTAVYRVHAKGVWSGMSRIDMLEKEFVFHKIIAPLYTEEENKIVEVRLNQVIDKWSRLKHTNNFFKRYKFSYQKKKEYKYARDSK